MAKNHQKFRSRCLIHEFFFHIYFLTILLMVTKQLYLRKSLCGCSRSWWLWLLFRCSHLLWLLWKIVQNDVQFNRIVSPYTKVYQKLNYYFVRIQLCDKTIILFPFFQPLLQSCSTITPNKYEIMVQNEFCQQKSLRLSEFQ